jgi:hypothetical protein
MPGALLDILDVIESLGCDHGLREKDEGAGTTRKRQAAGIVVQEN